MNSGESHHPTHREKKEKDQKLKLEMGNFKDERLWDLEGFKGLLKNTELNQIGG